MKEVEDGAGKGQSSVELLEELYPTLYKGFVDIQREQLELFAKKHLDYGLQNIAAGTNLETKEEVSFALTGLWYRISDKVSRFKNILMVVGTRSPNNESLVDTFQDLANYGIIAQLVSRGLWKR